ncbi:transglycosylase domain-containing protein [Quadrisphaera sp. DSM 44207]|uniref:transglycosylase domain-containing protein n=1 Tax=Quadrisphaera sp. DSM 44207 TaxID=1881057 RepID=UPI000886A16B|nr:transglycosylase domain-containing protein [Quadrisphaera sp. DSM 44207]SDQ23633.1 Membrane carboxypeptidase (penicillin-binding protein) [Quadrisphaera sp. DSM 44207]
MARRTAPAPPRSRSSGTSGSGSSAPRTAPGPSARTSGRPAGRAGGRPPGRRGLRRWLPSWKLVTGLVALLVAFGIGLAAIAYAAVEIPAPKAEAQARATTVYFADGTTELGTFAEVNREPLDPAEMPQVMKDAAVAAEDRSFYENRGVSLTGLGRAAWGVVTGQPNLGGGSTITQQFVKNVYLSSDRSYARKAREAVIAYKLDQRRTKDEILTGYLNTIYFGRGAWGVATAAQAYFGVDAAQLTPQQAALLMGIVPSPSNWDPREDPERAQERYEYVLASMVEMGHLDDATASASPQMPETVDPSQGQEQFAGPNGHVLQAAKDEAMARTGLDEDALATSGLSIVTTIDPRLQQAAIDTMADPAAYPTRNRPESVQAGLVSIDPTTGGVVAMYGGADYLTRSRNSVTQDSAQAGSTFKPLTLVAALEEDISLRERYDGSSPQYFDDYVDEAGDPVPVRNFGDDDYGRIDLLEATENSVNTVYVALNEDVGPAATVDVAQRLGIESEVPEVLSNVLGTATVRPIEMAEAYATFAAQGVHRDAHLVASVTQEDQVVYQADTAGEQVIRQEVVADATAAMQRVMTDGSAARGARALDRPSAGKTGTSQSNRAAWLSAFTPQLATTVVLYNPGPDGEQLELPPFGGARQITGGSVPTSIWTSFMVKALDDVDAEVLDFPEPAGIGRATSTPTRSASPSAEASRTPTPEASEEPTTEPTEDEEASEEATAQPTTRPGDEASGGTDGTNGADGTDGAGDDESADEEIDVEALFGTRGGGGGAGGGGGEGGPDGGQGRNRT